MFREPERALVSCCAWSFNTHGTGMLEPQLIGKYGKSYGSETLKWSGSVHFIRHSWSAPLPGGKQLLQTFPIGVLIEGLAGYSAGWATSDPHAQDMTSHVFRFLHTQVPQTHTHTHTLPPTRPGLNVLILITPNPRPASAASAFYKKSSIRWILKGLQPFCFGVLSEPLHSMVHGTQKDPKTQVENSYSVGVLNVPYRSRTS